MTSPIYKTFYGKYIDLDRLVSVSEASFEDRMGHGGYFVSFEMQFQLMEQPLKYTRHLKLDVDYVRNEDNEMYGRDYTLLRDDAGVLLCEKKLNAQIQEILNAWEEWKLKNSKVVVSFKN